MKNHIVTLSFWTWFVSGSGGRPGFARILNWWLVLHSVVGIGLAILVPVELRDAANSVLTPLVGLLIGLAFAWAANAQTLLQSDEMEDVASQSKGGLANYVYSYQLSVLVVLTTLILWGIAGLGVYDSVWPQLGCRCYLVIKYFLYLLASLTIRTCWHVVLGSQLMLLARWSIRESKK